MAGLVETEMGVRSDGEACLLLTALRLSETAPDSVGLADRHRIVEAFASDRADLADGLRPQLPALPLLFTLGHVGGKEQM